MYNFLPTFGAKNLDKKLELSKIQLFFQHFGKKSWKKVGRFPYNRESAPLPGSKWLPHIHETAPFNILLILSGRRRCNRRLRRCGIWCRTVLFIRRAGRYLILDIVSQRLLATRTVYESVRIPTSVPQIISMVIEFIAAILASAVKCRIIAFISRYRVGINHSCILEPGSCRLRNRLPDLYRRRGSNGHGSRSRRSNRSGRRRRLYFRCGCGRRRYFRCRSRCGRRRC